MNSKIKKLFVTAGRLLFSALALYFVFQKTDFSALQESLFKSNFLILSLSIPVFIASKVLSAYRLNQFFGAVEIYIPEKTNLRLYWLGMFYNLFLPGGIGGDGYKVLYLNRNMKAIVKKSILAIVFDRLTGLVALGALAMLSGLFVEQNLIPKFYFIIALLSGTALFYFAVIRWFSNFYGIFNLTNIQSLGVQVLQVISAWLILKSLGHSYQIISYLFVFLISSVVAAVPFTVGGIGAREITFLFASRVLNLDLTTSITLSLLFFLVTAIVSLPGVIYVIKPGWVDEKF